VFLASFNLAHPGICNVLAVVNLSVGIPQRRPTIGNSCVQRNSQRATWVSYNSRSKSCTHIIRTLKPPVLMYSAIYEML